jgi:uncharacterized membrane protein YhhN
LDLRLRGWKNLEYFAKPATMVALLAFVILNGGLSGGMIWFAIGLLFSLAGDVFLMLPKEQFIAGLVSFLLAHIAYIIGLAPRLPGNLPALLIAISLAIFIAWLPARSIAGCQPVCRRAAKQACESRC